MGAAGRRPGPRGQLAGCLRSRHVPRVGRRRKRGRKGDGTILRTADGGETWSKVPYAITHTPPPSGCYLITVHGANANEVWAVGRDQIIHVSVASSGIRVTDQTPVFGGGYDINGVFAVSRKTVWAVATAP